MIDEIVGWTVAIVVAIAVFVGIGGIAGVLAYPRLRKRYEELEAEAQTNVAGDPGVTRNTEE